MSLLPRLVALSSLLVMTIVQVDALPSTDQLESWSSSRDETICRAEVAFHRVLRLHQVRCADGVEGQVFEARGELFACRTVLLTLPFQDSDIDVAAGCVAVREGRRSDALMVIDKYS